MKRVRGGSGKPPRQLSEDDQALWQGTASTLEPLKRAKPRIHPAAESLAERGSKEAMPESASARTRQSPAPVRPGKAAQAPGPPLLAEFELRKMRRLSRGHVEIEARIDLHGLRQSEAHAALHRFILSCFARGLRHVLVITGKGAPSRSAPSERTWSDPEPSPGVLRRNVPVWLAEPELRALVVSFAPASPRHGGEGALYIHLRRRDRVG